MWRRYIVFFENRIFPFKNNVYKTKQEKTEEESKKYINNAFTFIEEKSKNINNDLLKTYFDFLAPIDLAKKIFETEDKKKSQFVEKIKIRWSNLKDEI